MKQVKLTVKNTSEGTLVLDDSDAKYIMKQDHVAVLTFDYSKESIPALAKIQDLHNRDLVNVTFINYPDPEPHYPTTAKEIAELIK